jgi:adenylate cyclase
MTGRIISWFAELRRRRVFRVAAVYAAVAFVIIQVTDIAFPALRLPDWSMTLVVVLTIVGFPLALVFAWIFDLTPDGLERTTSLPGAPGAAARPPSWTVHRIAGAGGVVILALAAGAFMKRDRPAEEEARRSIAVLPFATLTDGGDSEVFSDGIIDDIANSLSRVENLMVISRTSVMGYRNTTRRLGEIAAELGVTYVLEGSVRRAGDRIRLSVKLVDARRDVTLWSETYDRQVIDIFAIQTEIAESIAGALRLRLSTDQRARLQEGGTSSLDAYELYLQARRYFRDNPVGDWSALRPAHREMIALYRRAIELDPGYALAHAGLAWAYLHHPDLNLTARWDSAAIHARRAVELAPDTPDGYVALAASVPGEDRDAQRAHLLRAYSLNPNDWGTLLGLAEAETATYEVANALRYALRAVAIAPGEADPLWMVASLLAYLGEPDRAVEWTHRAAVASALLEWERACTVASLLAARLDDPRVPALLEIVRAEAGSTAFAARCAADIEMTRGNLAAARPLLEQYLATLDGGDGGMREARYFTLLRLGYVEMKTGSRERALQMLLESERVNREVRAECPGTCRNSALVANMALQGRSDEAISLLEDAIRTGWNGTYPNPNEILFRMYEPLYGDARYQRMMRDLKNRLDAERDKARREGLL